jgi:hypothetical protein
MNTANSVATADEFFTPKLYSPGMIESTNIAVLRVTVDYRRLHSEPVNECNGDVTPTIAKPPTSVPITFFVVSGAPIRWETRMSIYTCGRQHASAAPYLLQQKEL